MHEEGDRQDGEARSQGVSGGAGGNTAAPAAQGALTPRESEVLDWLAQGATDAFIAGKLGISPRTVGKHVENILAKLRVSSRTGAAVARVSRRSETREGKG